MPPRPVYNGEVTFDGDTPSVATLIALTRYLRETSRWMELVEINCGPKELENIQ